MPKLLLPAYQHLYLEQSVGFDSELTFISEKSKTLPVASTCSLVLWLPTALVDYEIFKERGNVLLTKYEQNGLIYRISKYRMECV